MTKLGILEKAISQGYFMLKDFMLAWTMEIIVDWSINTLSSSFRKLKTHPQYKCFQMEGNSFDERDIPDLRKASNKIFFSEFLFCSLMVFSGSTTSSRFDTFAL